MGISRETCGASQRRVPAFVVVEQEIHGDSSHNRREEKDVTDKYVCVQDCLS
jgi:hypothetical protein